MAFEKKDLLEPFFIFAEDWLGGISPKYLLFGSVNKRFEVVCSLKTDKDVNHGWITMWMMAKWRKKEEDKKNSEKEAEKTMCQRTVINTRKFREREINPWMLYENWYYCHER